MSQSIQNNEELLQALEQAKQLSREKDEFLSAVSHELRTPLTAIIGNNEIMAEGTLSDEQRQLLNASTQSSKRLLSLINDILDLSKIEANQVEVDYSPFDLLAMLDEVVSSSRQMEDSEVRLEVNLQLHPKYKVWGDDDRIRQILLNLIDNAFKFTRRGSVTLSSWIDGEKILFSVEDTGIGISAEVLELLFKPFQQADSSLSRRCGGTGLGLYIAQSLARLMSGEVVVTSEEGRGSRFLLTLPYNESELPVQEAGRGSSRESNEQYSGEVLIVEDTPELQLLEKRILEKFGVTATIANNGKEAIDLALENHYDLILMDMQMPVMDGIEATSRLREAGCKIPIAALTANVTQQYRKEFLEAGADYFLQKPINQGELKTVLSQYLRSQTKQTAPDQPLAAESAQQKVEQGPPYPVLAIDDEPAVLELYKTIFEGDSGEVDLSSILEIFGQEEENQESLHDEFALSVAPQGQVGVELARQALEQGKRFLVAFIDMRMPPGMNGLETAKALRKLDPYIFIVIVSAYSDIDQEQIIEELEYGVLYLDKPFHEREMLSIGRVLTQVCEGKNHLKQVKSASDADASLLKPSDESAEVGLLVDDELMNLFYRQIGERRELIRESLRLENWAELRSRVHMIKGTAETFGFFEVGKRAGEVQRLIDQDRIHELSEHVEGLLAEIDQILNHAG